MSEKPKFTKFDYYVFGWTIFLFFAVFWFFNAESWDQYLEGMTGFAMIGGALTLWDHISERRAK